MPTPIWLLDLDGVLNAHAERGDRHAWPAEVWRRDEVRGWPMLVAQPVIDFVRAVHDQGRAEIRWHTTWQHHAQDFADRFGLPRFAIVDAPEFEYPDDGFWKLPAIVRAVDEGRPLVWTDDDAMGLRPARRLELAERVPLLVIAPPLHVGLCPRHLRQIDRFLTDHHTPA
jgi:hypothetical protein